MALDFTAERQAGTGPPSRAARDILDKRMNAAQSVCMPRRYSVHKLGLTGALAIATAGVGLGQAPARAPRNVQITAPSGKPLGSFHEGLEPDPKFNERLAALPKPQPGCQSKSKPGQPLRLVSYGAALRLPKAQMGERMPVWGGNSVVVAAGPPLQPNAFLAIDRTGAVVFNSEFSIPGATHTSVRSWARGTGGTVALCGSSYASDGRGAPFIAWFSADGDSEHIIRTDPYTPNLIAVAPDGTVWTVGHELYRRSERRGGVDLNAGVLRHFDRSGKTSGAFLPRSSFKSPLELLGGSGYLAVSADRVGWFHYNGEVNGEGAYVEVTPGGEIASYPIPRLPTLKHRVDVSGLALTDAGDVFVSMTDVAADSAFSIFQLNRATKEWSPVVLAGVCGSYARLYGASGSELVFRVPEDPAGTFRFFSAESGQE
jgi:hypothetical protein